MDKKLKEKGFVLIAPECQNSDVAAIKSLMEKNDANYTVTKGVSGPVRVTGLPKVGVFDAKGQMVYFGRSVDEAEKVIKKALREVGSDSGSTSGLAARKKDLVPLRVWTNAEGNTMEASLVELKETIGTFKFANGKQFPYDITKLSSGDQDVIKKAATPDGEAE